MTDQQPRTPERRKADTLAKLSAPAVDVWVATAAAEAGGYASSHLVPLSLAWIDERVVLATEADSITARNIISQPHARLGLGPTRDVVMIDAELEQVYALDEVPDDLARRYALQADWDPRKSGDRMRFLVLRPLRIQAWREVNELPGRTLMRDGAWIT
ncbi:MAG TPA: pyridoxamine 5'-phosphate oxidase family protein [Streptosporangiaceae bacterium]